VNLVLESNFFEDAPDKTERLWNLLEVPSNTDENYGDVMEGWLVPPVTGDYTFWIASDDNGEFFFNPNYGIGYVDNASGRICYTPEYSGGREWDKDLKQKSQPIGLVKGQPYFFQVSVPKSNHRCCVIQSHGNLLHLLILETHIIRVSFRYAGSKEQMKITWP